MRLGRVEVLKREWDISCEAKLRLVVRRGKLDSGIISRA